MAKRKNTPLVKLAIGIVSAAALASGAGKLAIMNPQNQFAQLPALTPDVGGASSPSFDASTPDLGVNQAGTFQFSDGEGGDSDESQNAVLVPRGGASLQSQSPGSFAPSQRSFPRRTRTRRS